MNDHHQKRIVIVGGGFGGLFCALNLSESCCVTLIDPTERFLFTPMLYEYFSGEFEAWQIAPKYTDLLPEGKGFLHGKVSAIDFKTQTVLLEAPEEQLGYDVLILAMGSAPNFGDVEGAAQYALPFRKIEDAGMLRLRLTAAIAERTSGEKAAASVRSKILPVTIIGGNSNGVEIAAKIAELLQATVNQRELPLQIQTTIVERDERILPDADDNLRAKVSEILKQLNVTVLPRARTVKVTPTSIDVERNERWETLGSAVTVWTAGIEGNPLVQHLHIPTNQAGQILTWPTLQIQTHNNVFALGDAACCENAAKSLYGTAQLAYQQANLVADNVKSLLAGKELSNGHFKDLGEALSLGTTSGAVEIGGHVMTGSLARLTRFAAFLGRLPTWYHRLKVAPNWLAGGNKPKILIQGA